MPDLSLKRSIPPGVARLVWLAPVAVFYGLLVRFGQNIPTADDFQATLSFVYAFFCTGKTTDEQWTLLFSLHNEHRILCSRILSLALCGLTGQVNLLWLLWLQQLFWLLFAGLLGRLGQRAGVWRSVWTGLPVALLLFNPTTFDTLLNVWGGSQTYPALLFTVASLMALDRYTVGPAAPYWVVIAVVAAALATLSFGSGFLVWPGGALYLVFSRRYRTLAGWLAVAALALCFYLWRYEPPVHGEQLAQPLVARVLGTVKFIVLFPGAFLMTRWSSPALALPNLVVCYGMGVVSWLYALRLLLVGYGYRKPLLMALLGVSLATGLLLALGRGGLGGVGALVSRYQVFANLIPLVLYLIWVDNRARPGRLPRVASMLLVLLTISNTVQLWPVLGETYRQKEIGLQQWLLHKTPTLAIDAGLQQAAGQQLTRSIQAGQFVPSPAIPPAGE